MALPVVLVHAERGEAEALRRAPPVEVDEHLRPLQLPEGAGREHRAAGIGANRVARVLRDVLGIGGSALDPDPAAQVLHGGPEAAVAQHPVGKSGKFAFEHRKRKDVCRFVDLSICPVQFPDLNVPS